MSWAADRKRSNHKETTELDGVLRQICRGLNSLDFSDQIPEEYQLKISVIYCPEESIWYGSVIDGVKVLMGFSVEILILTMTPSFCLPSFDKILCNIFVAIIVAA